MPELGDAERDKLFKEMWGIVGTVQEICRNVPPIGELKRLAGVVSDCADALEEAAAEVLLIEEQQVGKPLRLIFWVSQSGHCQGPRIPGIHYKSRTLGLSKAFKAAAERAEEIPANLGLLVQEVDRLAQALYQIAKAGSEAVTKPTRYRKLFDMSESAMAPFLGANRRKEP